MYQVERCDINILNSEEVKAKMHTVFTTYPWISFLMNNQNAEPVVLRLSAEGEICAYFVGLLVRKFGVRILGSPLEGWFTPDMGFISVREFNIVEALFSVKNYAFKVLKCWYVQIHDKKITNSILDARITSYYSKELYLDISNSEDEIYDNFRKEAKKNIRQFNNRGATVFRSELTTEFSKTFYSQLEDVFAKQNLKPPYDEKKIRDIITAFLNDSDKILLLQVFDPDGRCIASSVSLGYGEWCYSLATASYRDGQRFMPNEKMRWEIIKYWKQHGLNHFDFVGFREYKLKFSPDIVKVPIIVFERIPGMLFAKNCLKKAIHFLRKFKGIMG